jgi:uncharacterized protein YndB with AHSA1/START domain
MSANNGQELVIERFFEAPRQRLWQAWTNPEQLQRWWGPKDFTAPYAEIDLRVGGKFRYCMRAPGGQEFWNGGVYRAIVPLEKIVVTDSFTDEQGRVVPAAHYGMRGDWPLELLVTVTFEEQDGKTKMTLRHVGIPAGENLENARAGWNQSFDKLAETLK